MLGRYLGITLWGQARGNPSRHHLQIMAQLTQSQMRRLCVSENVAHAAAAWKKAMLHQQTPPVPIKCVEEDADPDSGCRKLAISVPHPRLGKKRINTYALNISNMEYETYQTYMACVNACKVRAQRFRKDGLGIWLSTPREDQALGKRFTIIFNTDSWTHPEEIKQGLSGVDPDYLGPNLFITREHAAAAAAAQGGSSGWRICRVRDLDASLTS